MTSHLHGESDPGYRFCPKCGGALEKRVVEEHDPRERLICTRCSFIFYLDPKLAVGTIVHGPGGFLLLKRSIEPGYGKWTFPGGYVDRGESPEEAAIREAVEETGVRIRLGPLMSLYTYRKRGIIMMIYEAEAAGGEPVPTAEALAVEWTLPESIPWRELAFPSTRNALRDFLLRQGLGRHVPDDWEAGPEF